MRAGYKTVLVLATVVFLVGAAFCLAEEKKSGGKCTRMKLKEENNVVNEISERIY